LDYVDAMLDGNHLRVPAGTPLDHDIRQLSADDGIPTRNELERGVAAALHEALSSSPMREKLAAAREQLEGTVRDARRSGILPFCSAGNTYSEAASLSDDTDSLNVAAVKGMIVVGATELRDPFDREQDRSAYFSSGSDRLPGYVTLSTVGADVPFGPRRELASGTSFSTPIAASVAALMIEANPSLTPDDVERLMKRAVRDLPGVRDGAGELDPVAAVELAVAELQPRSSV
jgi:subtilisin family serine protease